MASQSRWGLTLPLSGLPLADQKDLVASLPDLGYTDVWSAELNGIDGFTPLTLASQWAPQLRLGTAIVGIYTRAPVSLAVQAGTLGALAPGKFVLGIGTSSQVAVEQWNGIPFEKPYQRSRDMLQFLREALAGGKVTREYETFSVNGFRLDPAPEIPPALALAALRPGMVRLAAAEAGIAITNWLAPKDVPQVRGVAGDGCELVARIFVCPTTDTDTARFIGRRMIAAYLTVPVYAAFHQWLGRGEIIEPMLTAWNAGDRKGALAAIPDALVDELVIHGSAEQCRERVAEYHATGLDTPVIAITPVPGIELAATIGKLAPA
ncbi:MAG TPA: LLM class F420-dependent oxidoreductase [Streptosporangiaceae bacterium]|jgi:probable F420-dependent oxidoreductase|nr:LLM class F420-dependent oxidoreductase [Streptosporangiaceae bacterium]